MKTVKIGILGAGFVANAFHMPALQEIEEAQVVAAFSNRREVAEQFAQRWGVSRVFHGDDGISKLCADPEVELVDIALPNNLHLTATLAGAENHKNVFCENPSPEPSGKPKRCSTSSRSMESCISMERTR